MHKKIDLLRNNDSKRNAENLSENGEARGRRIGLDTTTSDEPFAAKFSNCSRNAYCAASLLQAEEGKLFFLWFFAEL